MGGKVLDYEGRSIFYDGVARGRIEGRSETLDAAIAFMQSQGVNNDKIDSFRELILNKNKS